MKILIACEHSGTVREAFRAKGHDAVSCDILPASDGSPHHIQGDCLAALNMGWDMLIAHPPCTFLTVAAVWALKDPDFTRFPKVGYHQRVKPGTLTGAARRAARAEAIAFFRALWECKIPRVAIENPVGCMGPIIGTAQQKIQPFQFGEDASKGTCLWLRGIPALNGTKYIMPRAVCSACGAVERGAYELAKAALDHGCLECGAKCSPRWANQTDAGQNRLSPSEDRGHVRSITYPGIAQAMATQWTIA